MLSGKAAAIRIHDAPSSSVLASVGQAFPPGARVSGVGYRMALVSELCQEAGEEAKSSLVMITIQIGGPGPT